jgi:hypothetical protein
MLLNIQREKRNKKGNSDKLLKSRVITLKTAALKHLSIGQAAKL